MCSSDLGGVAGAVLISRTEAGGLGFRVITVGALGADRQQLLQVGAFAVGILATKDWAYWPMFLFPFTLVGLFFASYRHFALLLPFLAVKPHLFVPIWIVLAGEAGRSREIAPSSFWRSAPESEPLSPSSSATASRSSAS